nr:MAG TPA: hypothetical protein [Caudoviricetes sp.]
MSKVGSARIYQNNSARLYTRFELPTPLRVRGNLSKKVYRK